MQAAGPQEILEARAQAQLVPVRAQDLDLGMFVAELDRPWLETPFLFQGFVIGNASEIETIRKYCDKVFVDVTLSEPDARELLQAREAGAAAARTPSTMPPLTETASISPPITSEAEQISAPAVASVTRETRDRFRQLLQSHGIAEPSDQEDSVARRALARLRTLLRSGAEEDALEAATVARGAATLPRALRAMLPAETELHVYPDAHDVATELPRARQALSVCEAALSSIEREMQAGRPISIAGVEVAVQRLADSMIANPDALAWLARLREETQQPHLQALKVAIYMLALGRHLGLPRPLLLELGLVGLLADLGKARLPRALLDKPGRLEPAEYNVAKSHVQLGLDLLGQAGRIPDTVIAGIAQHHERLDGSGYPRGLRGQQIGLFGRIAAIADSFTALSAPRAYANPMSAQDALMGLYQWSGSLYDRTLVERFVGAIGVFPVGSLVELASGEVGIAVALERTTRLEPRLLLLTRPDKRPLPDPVLLAPSARGRPGDETRARIVSGLPSGAYGLRIRDYYAEIS